MKRITVFKELKDFLLLWGSQAVSSLGTAMTEYALVIWVYEQQGTATSTMLLTLCTFMPTILFRFVAGTLADRWDKKRIMLVCDVLAACGTAAILILHSLGALRVWHIYLINVLLSFMNAFQAPASFAATSLLVPEKHYARAGGLQGVSGAAISILSPALGSAVLAFGGLNAVLIIDLVSFAVAFAVLLGCIRLPKQVYAPQKAEETFLQSCLVGMRYLVKHKGLLNITLFIAATNFLAKLGNDGMLAPFVLSRTGNDQQILGMVQSSVAIGLLAGSMLVTVMKPVKKKMRLICVLYVFIFAGNVVQGLSLQLWVWCAAAFTTYMGAAVMNANLTAVLRAYVPLEMHGRVFSARDTLQNCTIPLSLSIGGTLADHVFAPFMATDSPMQRLLVPLFGMGSGAGIALMVFLMGVAGCGISLCQLNRRVYNGLEK
ncbi:MAG: MFS transporter [Clostridia bacterium]|nr:MFS transporter [Clostridia bacterium]